MNSNLTINEILWIECELIIIQGAVFMISFWVVKKSLCGFEHFSILSLETKRWQNKEHMKLLSFFNFKINIANTNIYFLRSNWRYKANLFLDFDLNQKWRIFWGTIEGSSQCVSTECVWLGPRKKLKLIIICVNEFEMF